MVQAELQLSKQSASEGKSACVGFYRKQGNLPLTDRISHYNSALYRIYNKILDIDWLLVSANLTRNRSVITRGLTGLFRHIKSQLDSEA